MGTKEIKTVIEYDADDEIYVASAPELSGCMAHGNTPEKAVHELEIAMDLWLQSASELGVNAMVPSFPKLEARRHTVEIENTQVFIFG